MALVVKDRVKQTTSTTGTGALDLDGNSAGFQTFGTALSNADTTYYALTEGSTGAWEVGLGTFATGTPNTLARTTVLASSNSGSAVNLTAGDADVFITQPAGKSAHFDANGDLILNQDPTTALMAATKEYVDTIAAAGIHYHDPVRVEKEGNLNATYDNGTSGVGATLTNAGTQAALVIDGVTMVLNDRVLIYEQTNAAHNGIYTVTNVGSASTDWVLTRATDADSYGPSDPDALGQGDAFFVSEGDEGAGETYVMTTEGTITFGTTDIVFSQISATQVYSAGDGLTLTGTTFAVGAGTGVTVNANDVAIGQAVGTSDSVTFAQVTAELVGNATTATAWETSRTVSLTGDVTGSATGVDGSDDVSIATTIAANSVALGTDTTGNYVEDIIAGNLIDVSGGGSETATVSVAVDLSELTTSTSDADGDFFAVVNTSNVQRKLTKGNINISGFNNDAGYTTNVGDITGVTAGNYVTGGGTSGTVTVNVDATSSNTASKVVARDASGNFSAGTITASLSGNATTATNISGYSGTYWTSNNDGAGSGLDADTVDGYQTSQSQSANTIAVRNASGYLFSNYFNGNGTFSTTGLTSGMARFTGTNGSDTYGRSYTPDAAKAAMGLATTDSPTFNAPSVTDLYVDDQIISTGDTNTYFQFHAADQARVVVGGAEVMEWRAGYVIMGDGDDLYFGNGLDFRIFHDGTNNYIRNQNHANGNIYIQGEDTSGVNHTIAAFVSSNAAPYASLYYDGTEVFNTVSGGVNVNGTITSDGLTVDTDVLYVDSTNDRVGVNKTNPAYDFDVLGNARVTSSIRVGGYIYHDGDTNSYLGFAAADDFRIFCGGRQLMRCDEGADPDILQFMDANNYTTSAGNWNMSGNVSANQYTATSDITLKENLLDIDGALQKISQINGYTYNFIKTPELRNAGLVAQEVEKVVPEAVTENSEGIKSIDYNGVIALLVSAIKEQQAEIDLLKEKIGA